MSQFFRFISLCDPCSRHYHAIVEFKDLKPRAKLITTLLTGLVGIVSLPVFGLLGVLTFRCLVRSFLLSKVKQIDPSQENSRIRNIEDQGIKNLSAQDVQSEKSTVFLEEKIVQTPILQTSEFENEAIEQKVDVGVQSTTLIQPEIEKESKEIILDKNDLQKDEPQEEFSLRMSEFSDAADFSENILILTGLELQRIQRKQESHEETMEQQKSLDCLIEKQSKNSIHDFQTDEIEEVLEGKKLSEEILPINRLDLQPGQWVSFISKRSGVPNVLEKPFMVINREDFAFDPCRCYLMSLDGELHDYCPESRYLSFGNNRIDLPWDFEVVQHSEAAVSNQQGEEFKNIQQKALLHLKKLAFSAPKYLGRGFYPENPSKTLTAQEIQARYPEFSSNESKTEN